MFSALATVIIQGILPNSTNNIIVALYGLSSSLSFAFLFISIILCIQIVRVSSEFMYTKAYKQRRIFSKLLTDFKKKFGKEKSIAIGLVASSPINRSGSPTIDGLVSGGAPVPVSGGAPVRDAPGQGGRISPTGNINNKRNKRASLVQDDNYISMQWKSHVETIRNYLNERTNINKALIDTEPNRRETSSEIGMPSGIGMPSFENHWKKHLKYFSLVASQCFFLGTGFLQGAILLYLWAIFDIYYSSRAGAIISVTIIGLALSISLVALRRLCFHSSRSKVAANNADAAAPVSNVEDPVSPTGRLESAKTEDSSFSSTSSFIDNLFQKKKKT